jgi:dihydrolipoamide dehydrogenase
MEWASLYNDCGVEVTVVESQQRILLNEDEEVAKEAHRIFSKRGIRFHSETTVSLKEIQTTANGVNVPAIQKDGTNVRLEAEAILLSVGRHPNVEGIHAPLFELAKKGSYITVNELQQTNIAGIYAIGDVCGGGLAHVAALQGTIAIEHLAGLSSGKSFHALHVPKCTYTRPEIASIGYTEAGAKQAGYEVKIGKFPFRAIGKALVYGEIDGFAKIITDSTDGKILGAHLIGPHATDLIAESGVVLANELLLSQWLKSIHPHPSLSEVVHEALLAVDQRAIHM